MKLFAKYHASGQAARALCNNRWASIALGDVIVEFLLLEVLGSHFGGVLAQSKHIPIQFLQVTHNPPSMI